MQSSTEHQRYAAARLSQQQRDVYVTVFVGVSIHRPQPAVQLTIVEEEDLEASLVRVDPDFPRQVEKRLTFDPADDVQGGRDHPLISRYAGTRLLFYSEEQYGGYVLPLGAVESYRDEEGTLHRVFSNHQELEGRITRLQYEAPRDRSVLEIHRTYEQALTEAGFSVLFAGHGSELGQSFAAQAYPADVFAGGVRKTRDVSYYVQGSGDQQRFLAARLADPAGDVYVTVYTAISIHKPEPTVQVEVIELVGMDDGLVSIDVDVLEFELQRTGSAALYGIHFATDSDRLTSESRPALDAIGQLLQRQPHWELFVVGHTDWVGAYSHNLDLSQRRAEAVVRDLAENYGIDAGRLTPVGVGPVAPAASNETAEGRAQNRRVELVVRSQ